MKKRNIFNMLARHMMVLTSLVCLAACHDEEEYVEDRFLIEYGTVEKFDQDNYVIRLDKGPVLLPTEEIIPGRTLKNESRVDIDYAILQEAPDSCVADYYVRINYLNEIPTWNIVPYSPSLEDSLGHDPVSILNTQIANGFITVEFYYEASDLSDTHLFSLTRHDTPTSDGRIRLEFRHNAYGDKGTNKFGHVCFRLKDEFPDTQDSIRLSITYKDFNDTRSLNTAFLPEPKSASNFMK